MAESSLSIGYNEFCREVAGYLGWGYNPNVWTADQQARLDDIIASALRQFYTPPLIANQQTVHEWSFLRPTTTLVTVTADFDYTLPDAFASIDGPLTYAATVSQWPPVRIVSEQVIRELQQLEDRSGRPELAAVRPRAADGTAGQRFEILLYPTPDSVYTLTYRYNALPSALSPDNPYPLGGMYYGETILAACLAIAEQRFNDMEGPKTQAWMRLLDTAVRTDQLLSAPEHHGYNGDNSRDRDVYRVRTRESSVVTYNGVEYD